jgi:hypothetical protein
MMFPSETLTTLNGLPVANHAAAAVEHDHIVRVYATSDPSDPVLYVAMEFVAWPSLAERVRADQPPGVAAGFDSPASPLNRNGAPPRT